MSVTYYCADLHLGHRLVAGHRGFGEDTDAHDAEIVQRWTKAVREDDIVVVIGDLAVSSPTYALALLAELPGRKRLISGNHDVTWDAHRDAPRLRRKYGFDDVFEWIGSFGRRKINGQTVLLSHFPYAPLPGAGPDSTRDHTAEPRYLQYRLPNLGEWLLHGHTHSTEIWTSPRELHVGWDAWRRLVPEHEIAALIQS